MVERLPIVVPSEIAQRVETGYFGRIRQNRTMKATAEYIAHHAAIAREIQGVWLALAGVREAQHEYNRAYDLYANPEVVLEADRSRRRTDLKQAQTSEYKADTELMRAQMEHAKLAEEYRGKLPEPEPVVEPPDTQEADEFEKELGLSLGPEMFILQKEKEIRTFIEAAGGEDKLTDDERELIRSIRAKCEQMRKAI